MAVKPPPESTADKAPGAAGALLRRLPGSTADDQSSSSSSSSAAAASAGVQALSLDTVAEDWTAICQQLTRPPVVDVASPDQLLERGIADYTVVPNVPLLGKGKFSVVYRASKGGREYAIKHTPLHPHHPLIATRLIREPELLAQLEPHPNLIRVFETIRTEGHFYLIEEYLPAHISLDALCQRFPHQRLPFPLVLKIFQQLVSVVRDGLHRHCVCHRDIKPENILIEPETGHITLIDMGLATPFSLSSPKLSTCCGSPAFHSPEIVLSLSRPPGEVHYWGSDVDIWCVALSVLRCWTGRRYPIGTGHKSLSVMRGRVDDLLALISRDVMDDEDEDRRDEERKLRETLRGLLDLDSSRRMRAFKEFDVGDEVRDSVERFQRVREFKQTTFQTTALKYTLPLQLTPEPLPPAPVVVPTPSTTEPPTSSTLVIRNPTEQHPVKVVSFLKYALRCANILYHCRSTETHATSAPGTPVRPLLSYFPSMGPVSSAVPPPMSPVPDLVPSGHPGQMTIFQCVATLPALPDPPSPPLEPLPKERRPFLPSLFRSNSASPGVRSSSTPAGTRTPPESAEQQRGERRSASGTRKPEGKDAPRHVVFLFALRFSSASAAAVAEERRQRRQRSVSRRGGSRSRASSKVPPLSGSGSGAPDLILEELSSRLTETRSDRRPTHSRQSSYNGLPTLHPQEAALLTPTTVSRHPSIRRERSASGSASGGSASSNSTPPLSPAVESLQALAGDPSYHSGKRSMTVRPSSRIRSISTAGARAPSLSRSSTSSSYGHPHLPLHHHPAYLTESLVLVHVSNPLALPALQAAFTIVPPTPSTDAGTPLVSPAPLSSSLQESPTAIPIPPKHASAARPSMQRQQSSLNEDDEDDEPRRGRSEARSADSFSSSTSGGSGGKLAKAMNARRFKPSTPMPTLRSDSQDDRTPTATPAPTDRQRQPAEQYTRSEEQQQGTPPLAEQETPPTPYADVRGPRIGSISSEGSNDGPLCTPGVEEAALDATRIVDARKNSSASELFEGLGLRGMTSSSVEKGSDVGAMRRGKSPAVRGWGWGESRNLSERSRSVGLFDR